MCYGGSPRRVIHRSSDISDDEKERMLQWTDKLRDFGDFGDFLAGGGKCWIDMPLPTERRLLLRVFSTTEAGRGLWFFLGLFLAKGDCAGFLSYGHLVEFLESRTVEEIRDCGFLSGSDKLIAEVGNEINDRTSQDDPPLFSSDLTRDWLESDWVIGRTSYRNQIAGDRLFIAFNPPKIYSQFTALLLSKDFPFTGLRLAEPDTSSTGVRDEGVQKKSVWSSAMAKMVLVAAVCLATAFGTILLSSLANPQPGYVVLFLDEGNNRSPSRVVQIPRGPISNLRIRVHNRTNEMRGMVAESTDDCIRFGGGRWEDDHTFIIPVEYDAGRDANSPIMCDVSISEHRDDGDKLLVRVPVEVESAEISLQESLDLRHDMDTTQDRAELEISGVATARYGIANVLVNEKQASLAMTTNGQGAHWCIVIEATDVSVGAMEVVVEVTDMFDNAATFKRRILPFAQDVRDK